MEFLETLYRGFLFFAAISLVFIPLEYAWSPKKGFESRSQSNTKFSLIRWFRPEWFNDFAFFLGQMALFNSVTIYVLNAFFRLFDNAVFLAPLIQLPLAIKIILAIFFGDLLIYWGHRAQHRFSWLWRFHRVHHTAPHVDYLAAYREHPLDNIYTRGLETLPAVLLGLDLNLIAGFVTFRGLWALFIHSNVTIRLGWIEMLLGSPHLHHWHHELHRRGLCNYANLSPLMDLLFGTYFNPPERPREYGIEEIVRHGWFWQMVDPLWVGKKTTSAI